MPGFLGSIQGQVRLNVRQAVGAYALVRAQNARTMYALRGAGDAFISSGKSMILAGGLMAYGIGKAVNAAADFERKMDFFAAVTDTNTAKMKTLSKFTLQLAQDTIYSAGQVADGFIELGKSGIKADDIIAGVGKAMTSLGAATDIPLVESGQIIVSTMQAFGKSAKDAVKITDLLAGAANASIADISDIGTSLKYVGGVANIAGVSLEDTVTAISLLAKAGIRGSTAGTSLRQMLVSFGGATKPARAALQQLGILTYNLSDANETLTKVTGQKALPTLDKVKKALAQYVQSIDGGTVGTVKNADAVDALLSRYGGLNNQFYDSKGNLKDLGTVFQILQNSLKGYNKEQKLQLLRTIFNNRALSSAALLTRSGAKGFKNMYNEMKKVKSADVARKRLDNLSGDIEILRGNVETLLVQAGGPLQTTLRGWVKNLTKLVQAFGKLDPKTQQIIIKSIALASAMLIAMGAVNLVIGLILKFIYHMIRMGAAIRFVWGVLRPLATLLAGPIVAALGAISLPVLAVIAVIVALAAAFIIAYKKIKPFHDWVNRLAKSFKDNFLKPLGRAAKAVFNFLRSLNKKKLEQWWNSIKSGASRAFHAVINWFKRLPGRVASFLAKIIVGAANWGKNLVSTAVTWLGNLFKTVVGFMKRVQDAMTLRNLGYAIGYALGLVVRLFIKFGVLLFKTSIKITLSIVNAFRTLGPKVIGFFVRMVLNSIAWMRKMATGARQWAIRTLLNVLAWLQKLPGRVRDFFVKMFNNAVTWLAKTAVSAYNYGRNMLNNFINWVSQLPGRARRFFIKVVTQAIQWIGSLPHRAHVWGQKMFDNMVSTLEALPGKVGDILGNVIQAFLDVIQKGFNAAKDFAGGLWQGFKDGIGLHSPSFIEKAMFQLNDNMKRETRKLASQTANIQKLGQKFASTNFEATIGTPSLRSFKQPLGVEQRMTVLTGARQAQSNPIVIPQKVEKKTDITVNNPRPERAGKSVSKTLRDASEEEGWMP